jgi:hypothetical protein
LKKLKGKGGERKEGEDEEEAPRPNAHLIEILRF